MRKLLPWILGATLAIPVALPLAAPATTRAQEACPVASPTPEPSAEPVLMPEDARIGLFESVWGTIAQGYLDPEFNGRDWDAIGDQYAPLFLQIEDAWQLYDLTEEMVAELDDEETRFISPLIIENLSPVETDYVGIGALVDSTAAQGSEVGPRILYLFPGSGAAEAGLQPRDRVVSVDGDPCVTIAAIRGPEGTTVTLGVESPGQPVREVVVERRRIEPLVLPIASTLADGSIGYLRLPSMERQELLDGVAEELDGFRGQDLDGLIIDVRSVGLGGLGVTVGILAHLLDGDAGTLYSRDETSPLDLPESELLPAFRDLPLVVIVDEDSGGEAERLAAILQAADRARVVGQETPGRMRSIQEVPLDGGAYLQVVTVGLELPDGTRPDREGVTPDVIVDEDWLAFPEAEDPYLLAALELLGAEAGEASPSVSVAPAVSAAPASGAAPGVEASPAT